LIKFEVIKAKVDSLTKEVGLHKNSAIMLAIFFGLVLMFLISVLLLMVFATQMVTCLRSHN